MRNAECEVRNEFFKMENIIDNKSFDFAVRTVNLYKYLTNEKRVRAIKTTS